MADGATVAREHGVYVHFPWCLRKCPYCDFLSIARDPATLPHDIYADAILSERRRRLVDADLGAVASVFFGGGTPSLWLPAALGRVLAGVAPERSTSVEVTVECNPSSLDEDKARALRDVGVNRLSIGVQSLARSTLEFLGRWHGPEDALRALNDARRAGIPRVSADLIIGVHGQRPEHAAEEARRLLDTGITHLSAYTLTIEPGTQFGQRQRAGVLPLLDESTVADCYLAVEAVALQAGLAHYEISNYARPGDESRHNLGYWRGAPYLGLGVGAWGTLPGPQGHHRYRNTVRPDLYLTPGVWDEADLSVASADGLQREREELSPDTTLSERIMLGLRLSEGLDLEAAAQELGTDPWPPARRRAAEKWLARGGLRQRGNTLFLAPEAWLHADGILAELM
ncbi:MAG: radical SAM family heme chaperone HemW [Polyangiaceae bacterium]